MGDRLSISGPRKASLDMGPLWALADLLSRPGNDIWGVWSELPGSARQQALEESPIPQGKQCTLVPTSCSALRRCLPTIQWDVCL